MTCAMFKPRVNNWGMAVMPRNSRKFLRYNENVRSRISPSDSGRSSHSAMNSSCYICGQVSTLYHRLTEKGDAVLFSRVHVSTHPRAVALTLEVSMATSAAGTSATVSRAVTEFWRVRNFGNYSSTVRTGKSSAPSCPRVHESNCRDRTHTGVFYLALRRTRFVG